MADKKKPAVAEKLKDIPEFPAEKIGAPEQQREAFVPRNQGEDAPKTKERVSFAVTDDGRVDWDTLKGKNRDKVTAIFKSDPEIARLAGVRAAEVEDLFSFTPEKVQPLLRVLGQVNSWATQFVFTRKGMPIDPDILDRAFQFDPKDEKQLSEMGANLANRYSSEWMRQHAELIVFLTLYMKCVYEQTKAAVIMQIQRSQQPTPQPVRPNGHAEPQPVRVHE